MSTQAKRPTPTIPEARDGSPAGLRVYDRISDAVGWTPLVRLHRSVDPTPSEVYAKVEYMNPMGSIKDRIARYMVTRAVEEGALAADGTIVEAS